MHANEPSVLQYAICQLRIVPSAGQVPQIVFDAGSDVEAADGQVVLFGRALRDLGGQFLAVQPPGDLGGGSSSPRHAHDVRILACGEGLVRTGDSDVGGTN